MRAFVVTVAAAEAELAADALWGLGVVAVEERAGAGGDVELWTSLGDDAADHAAHHAEAGEPMSDAVQAALHDWPASWRWRFEYVDESVADSWRAHAEPVLVDAGLVVRPAWVEFDAPEGTTVLQIEPGATFGMGDHPTTILCLRAVRRLVSPGCAVLDVGCGSGVLAVAACVFGAHRAVGIDIAPAAVPVTAANARANGVGRQVTVSTTSLADVEGQYELVVANILAPTLVALADHLCRVVAPGGALVVSGVLADRHQHVLQALVPLTVERTELLDGWAAITLRR